MPGGARFQVAWLIVVALSWSSAAARAQSSDHSEPSARLFGPAPTEDWLFSDAPGGLPGRCPEGGAAENQAGAPPCAPSGPLGSPLLASFAAPTGRYRGPGNPLLRESWQNRQFSAGAFLGADLHDDAGLFSGLRLGWDASHYWGSEMRFTFGQESLYESFFQWDLDLLCYPWGDAEWRPYFLVGVGVAKLDFVEEASTRPDQSVFAVPLAIGVKYRCNRWVAVRIECADNIVLQGDDDFDARHVVLLSGGVEFRFGGPRRSYWPWNPGVRYW